MDGPTEAIRGEVRAAGYRRVSHGLFLPERQGLSVDEEFRRELRAWLLVLPPDARFTHITAARLRGWTLSPLPEHVPVFAAVHAVDTRRCRTGLILSRLVSSDRDGPAEGIHGLPVEPAEEILLRAARDLGHLDLVTMIDSALRLGDIDPRRMAVVLASRRPGTRPLQAAYDSADHRAESGGESVLRVFHLAMDIDVEPQVTIRAADGREVARADLLVVGTGALHEYDGAGHRTKEQQRSDLRRERRLAGTAYVRRGFTLDDLLNHPTVTMHELDRALGRPHRVDRLRRWRRLVDQSMYSEGGRARMTNRWRRRMGILDWSRFG